MAETDYLLPWERQPEEGDEAWEAFRVFRDLPYTPYKDEDGRDQPGRPRSQRETARRVGKYRSLIDKWAAKHAWQSRVRAFDADIDRDRRAKLKSQALAAVTQHGQMAGLAIRHLAMPLQALAKPQVLVDAEGMPLLVDGVQQTRDRLYDLERMATPGLLLLMRQVASLMPTLVQIRMEALGNPHEPLPEVPEFGAADAAESEGTTPDRMRELLAAMDESGLLAAAGMTPAAEQATVEEADALVNGDAP